MNVSTVKITEAKIVDLYPLNVGLYIFLFSDSWNIFQMHYSSSYFLWIKLDLILTFTFIFLLAERPKYTFDFSEEEDDEADDDDDNNDLEELKVKASPVTNDGEDEFVPSDGLDKDEYTFSLGKSKAAPE